MAAGDGGGDDRIGRPPIFVVGCPRSGTTMVRQILDSHPGISCGPESRFLWGLRGVEERNWSSLAGFGLSLDAWHAKVRELFEAPHRAYAASKGKVRWADKSPDYALMLDYIDALYPEAQIVHVVRDPRDVIESWRHFYGPRSLKRAAQSWVRYVRAAHDFARSQPEHRAIEIRYEDLVREPEPTLRKLFAWLGEPWDDAVLRFGEQRHSLAGGPLRVGAEAEPATVRSSSVGKGNTAYAAAALMLVRRNGRDLLRVFGYS